MYICMSAQCCWARVSLWYLHWFVNEHGPAEARQFYRKRSRTLLKETDTSAVPRLRGSSVGTALHEIICGKLLPVDLEWGGGFTFALFFYGAHGEDISTIVMFQRMHARLWSLRWSPTGDSLFCSCFGKASSPFEESCHPLILTPPPDT